MTSEAKASGFVVFRFAYYPETEVDFSGAISG